MTRIVRFFSALLPSLVSTMSEFGSVVAALLAIGVPLLVLIYALGALALSVIVALEFAPAPEALHEVRLGLGVVSLVFLVYGSAALLALGEAWAAIRAAWSESEEGA